MDVYELPDAPAPDMSYRRDMAALVELAGRQAFPRSLFQTAQAMCNAAHLTAFRLSASGTMHTVLAENTGATLVAQSRANRYVRDYWRYDPAARVATFASRPSRKSGRWVVRTVAAEIEHACYRSVCYSSVMLDNRISISEIRGDQLMRVNFYRRQREQFSDDEARKILDTADLLMPLIWRHDEDSRAGRNGSPAELFRTRLAAVAPALSERERQVCALVALGLTSEGIALELGIGINTVLTYRKRAYARLNISSQNELIRLFLM